VKGTHFENPGYALTDSATYDYLVVDNNPGNLVRVTDSYFLQDAPAGGPSHFMLLKGGNVILCGVGMFTPAGSPMRNFALLVNGAKVDAYGFNDLSGNITGPPFGR
jgi:hypothetical protein